MLSRQVAAAAVSPGLVPIQSPAPSLPPGPTPRGRLPSETPRLRAAAGLRRVSQEAAENTGLGSPTPLARTPGIPASSLGAGMGGKLRQEAACPREPGLGERKQDSWHGLALPRSLPVGEGCSLPGVAGWLSLPAPRRGSLAVLHPCFCRAALHWGGVGGGAPWGPWLCPRR